jgi:predicted permease
VPLRPLLTLAHYLEDFLHDLRHEALLLIKKPGFTVATVFILTLAIGANTAIFSILDPLLLRDLPVQSPAQLVAVEYRGSLGLQPFSPYPALQRYRDAGPAFAGFLGFGNPKVLSLTSSPNNPSVRVLPVTSNYFTLLGVRPALGRLLLPEDDPFRSAAPVAVLSFFAWQKYFDSDSSIIGRSVGLGPSLYTIVGVTPPSFFGLEVGYSPEIYIPINPAAAASANDAGWVTIFGRLNPNFSLARAQHSLEPLVPEIASAALPAVEIPQDMASLILVPASRGLSDLREQFSRPVKIVMGIVLLVLLIACCNVANLLLAQGVGRRREITVRLALGASRSRLIRQLLAQTLILVSAGALGGILVGNWASALLVRSLSTSSSSIALNYGVTPRIMLFAVVVLTATVLLAGLVPSLLATRSSIARDLQTQTVTAAQSIAFSSLTKAFLVTQIALSVALLCAAGLLARSLRSLESYNAGFDREHVLALTLTTSGHDSSNFWSVYSAPGADRILARIRSLPVVRSASLSTITPISNRQIGINVSAYLPSSQPASFNAQFNIVSPHYFETLGIPLLVGRDFTPEESAQNPARVAIVNLAMARRLFGDLNALGKQFQMIEGKFPPLQIVGVVANSKYNDLREKDIEFFYMPGAGPTLEVRATADPAPLIPSLRKLVSAVDPTVTVSNATTLRRQVNESLRHDEIISALCGSFSFLALLLTCVGLVGVLSFSVASRTSEIGLRLALGAQPHQVFTLILGQGLNLVAFGLLLGYVLAYFSASLLATLLFGIQPRDLTTYALVLVFLLAASALACYLPARRASLLDPALALRHE